MNEPKNEATGRIPVAACAAEGAFFDREALLERVMRDDGLVRLVLSTFVADMPVQMDALRAALASGDEKGVRRQAHTIKGAAANVGAMGLSQWAQTMENLCVVGRLQEVAAMLTGLDDLWDKTLSAMGMGPDPSLGRSAV